MASMIRSLARSRAKEKMRRKGMRRVCSKKYRKYSWFSENWRDYVM
jgi:hypothetical protein